MNNQKTQFKTEIKLPKAFSNQANLNTFDVTEQVKSPDEILENALDNLQNKKKLETEEIIFHFPSNNQEKEQDLINALPDPLKLNPNVRTFTDIQLDTEQVPKKNVQLQHTHNKDIKGSSTSESDTKKVSPESYVKRIYTSITGRHITKDMHELPGAINKVTEKVGDAIQDIPDPVLSGVGFVATGVSLFYCGPVFAIARIVGSIAMATSFTKTTLDVIEKEKPLKIGALEFAVEGGGMLPYGGPLVDMGSFLFDFTKYKIEQKKEEKLHKQ